MCCCQGLNVKWYGCGAALDGVDVTGVTGVTGVTLGTDCDVTTVGVAAVLGAAAVVVVVMVGCSGEVC